MEEQMVVNTILKSECCNHHGYCSESSEEEDEDDGWEDEVAPPYDVAEDNGSENDDVEEGEINSVFKSFVEETISHHAGTNEVVGNKAATQAPTLGEAQQTILNLAEVDVEEDGVEVQILNGLKHLDGPSKEGELGLVNEEEGMPILSNGPTKAGGEELGEPGESWSLVPFVRPKHPPTEQVSGVERPIQLGHKNQMNPNLQKRKNVARFCDSSEAHQEKMMETVAGLMEQEKGRSKPAKSRRRKASKSKNVIFRGAAATIAMSLSSISSNGIRNRNKLLLNESEAAWKVGNILGLDDDNPEEVVRRIAQLEKQDEERYQKGKKGKC